MQGQVAQEMKRADNVAKLVMGFSHNEAGQELANVQTSQGF